jgi:hypothetical protein
MTLEEYVRESLTIWAEAIEGYVTDAGDDLPAELEKLAASFTDRALADWVRDHGNPRNIRREVARVRLKMARGDLVGALKVRDGFETDRRFMEQLLNRPYMLTGRKLRDRPNKGGRAPGSTAERDRAMAEEFLRRCQASNKSDTALKEEIGRKAGLKRSAAVAAINRGVKKLSG